jgi:hypothetical protein
MPPVIEYEVFRDHLGVAAGDPAEDDVSRLFDAINARIRRLTRRDFEGDTGGSYDQVIRIRGMEEFTLPHVPVRDIASIARVAFDGTEDAPYETTDYRVEDAERGLIRLRRLAEYVRVVWTTTGEMSAAVPQACLDWGKARWDATDRPADLAGYTTGQDSESYFEAVAGRPPRDVLLTLLGERRASGGGVV